MDTDRVLSALGLACILVSCVAIVQWYWTSQSLLRAIPTIGYSFPLLSYITVHQYKTQNLRFIQEGYAKYKPGLFKIAQMDQWMIFATSTQLMEDIRDAPDDVLSVHEAIRQMMQSEYTLGIEAESGKINKIVKSQLTRGIASIFHDVRDEIVMAFEDIIPAKTNGWTNVPMPETLQTIISRVSNRVFVGAPLCRDTGYQQLNVDFTVDAVINAMTIRRYPWLLKPIVGRLVSCLASYTRREADYLSPIIEDRRNKLRDYGSDWKNWEDRPRDMLMWLMEITDEKTQSAWNLARQILYLNFVAIHTSASSFTHVMYHLAAGPEYMQPLREEVESIIAAEGWSKAAMDKMHKVDSFIRESQRFNGIALFSMTRLALKPFTFSNGVTVPAGTLVCAASRPTHTDDAFYPHAATFDGFRFAVLREEEITKHQMVSTSTHFLPFGHGRHACPGRFFAANELKAMLAHVVLTYDVKFEDGKGFPPNVYVSGGVVPGSANVLFRRRQR